jgi:hypothetical protein
MVREGNSQVNARKTTAIGRAHLRLRDVRLFLSTRFVGGRHTDLANLRVVNLPSHGFASAGDTYGAFASLRNCRK